MSRYWPTSPFRRAPGPLDAEERAERDLDERYEARRRFVQQELRDEGLNMLYGPPPMSWLTWQQFTLLMACRSYAAGAGGVDISRGGKAQ